MAGEPDHFLALRVSFTLHKAARGDPHAGHQHSLAARRRSRRKMAQELDYLSSSRGCTCMPRATRVRCRRRVPDQGQSRRQADDGRRSAPAGDAGEADPGRFLQVPLRAVDAPAAERASRQEGRPVREDGAGLPAARHRRRRLHPRRPRLLGRANGRTLCRRGSHLGDPCPPGAALLSDPSVGYEYPQNYLDWFGADYRPDGTSRKTTSARGTTSGT